MIEITTPGTRTETEGKDDGSKTLSGVPAQSVDSNLGRVDETPYTGMTEVKAVREAKGGGRGGTLALAKNRVVLEILH